MHNRDYTRDRDYTQIATKTTGPDRLWSRSRVFWGYGQMVFKIDMKISHRHMAKYLFISRAMGRPDLTVVNFTYMYFICIQKMCF